MNTGGVYRDIFRRIPPATHLPAESEPPPPIEALWSILVACWNPDPEARPTVYEINQFIANHGPAVVSAFEEGFIAAPALLI
jgi:hypothetical protein